MFGIPIDPDGELPDDAPEFVVKMFEQAKERKTHHEMSMEAFANDIMDHFAEKLSLAEVHFLTSVLDWINDGPDEIDVRSRISHLTGAMMQATRMRESNGEECENCAARQAQALGLADG